MLLIELLETPAEINSNIQKKILIWLIMVNSGL